MTEARTLGLTYEFTFRGLELPHNLQDRFCKHVMFLFLSTSNPSAGVSIAGSS